MVFSAAFPSAHYIEARMLTQSTPWMAVEFFFLTGRGFARRWKYPASCRCDGSL